MSVSLNMFLLLQVVGDALPEEHGAMWHQRRLACRVREEGTICIKENDENRAAHPLKHPCRTGRRPLPHVVVLIRVRTLRPLN
jgi:hypothetical protein